MKHALLALADGTLFEGRALGYEGETVGEVVFNTAMTGYQEVLTDPSYKGQIITMTCPHIGNYGVTPEDIESRRIWAEGFIVKEASALASNWRSKQQLQAYLQEARSLPSRDWIPEPSRATCANMVRNKALLPILRWMLAERLRRRRTPPVSSAAIWRPPSPVTHPTGGRKDPGSGFRRSAARLALLRPDAGMSWPMISG